MCVIMASERLEDSWILVHNSGQHLNGGAWFFAPFNTRISPHPARSLRFESTPSHGGVSYILSVIITILVVDNPSSGHVEEPG